MSEPNWLRLRGPRHGYTPEQREAVEQHARTALEGMKQDGDVWRIERTGGEAFRRESLLQFSTNRHGEAVATAMTATAALEGWMTLEAHGTSEWHADVERALKRLADVIEQASERNRVERAPAEPARTSEPERESKRVSASTTTDPDTSSVEDDTPDRHRIALEAQLQQQWRVAGDRYYFRGRESNKLAFRDRGESISTDLNTERVTAGVVQLAEAKGWTSIHVSGHEEFKRQVWREATARGMTVSGYEPTEQEQRIAAVRSQPQSQDSERNVVTNGERQVERDAESTKPEREKGIAGRLVEHGSAPYQHDPKKSASYYATIETESGERTVWGIGLHEAIGKADAQVDDRVRLKPVGSKEVTVTDEDGEPKVSHRNTWQVTHLSERARVVQAVADRVVDERISDSDSRERVRSALAASVAEADRKQQVSAINVQDEPKPRHGRELSR